MNDNPYEPAVAATNIGDQGADTPSDDAERAWITDETPRPGVSPIGTTLARHIAAIVDNISSAVVAIVAAKQFPDESYAVQIVSATLVYFGYHFVFESLFRTSPGKLLTGLKILSFDGSRCSTKQIAIRTLLRVFEVNPLLLGALPAAARIIFSRDKQRFGDTLAGTIVVFR